MFVKVAQSIYRQKCRRSDSFHYSETLSNLCEDTIQNGMNFGLIRFIAKYEDATQEIPITSIKVKDVSGDQYEIKKIEISPVGIHFDLTAPNIITIRKVPSQAHLLLFEYLFLQKIIDLLSYYFQSFIHRTISQHFLHCNASKHFPHPPTGGLLRNIYRKYPPTRLARSGGCFAIIGIKVLRMAAPNRGVPIQIVK